jgi:gliding motility-associated-like protein
MRIFYLLAFLLFNISVVVAQTFNGTGGAIPGSGVQLYNATVSSIGAINSSKGLSQVCMNINHPAVDELEILLQAPDGTYVPLTIQNGAAFSDNYTNTCFSATASTPIKFGTAPFTGTFLPEGHLGAVNNGQNADGVWRLYIRDRRNATTTGTGSIANWSLTFSNNPAPQPPTLPNCTTTIPSTSDCASASSICDFNGACGSTTGSTKRSWTALDNASCFGLNNNSFVKFIADAPTVSFSVWVTSSKNGFNNANGGIQMLFFSTPNCGGPVTTYGCYNRIYPNPAGGKPLINLIYATGLTPGNTYYLMTDGANGDLCDFRIAANSGINALTITPSNTSICQGNTVTLNASGGNSTFSWSANSPNAGLSATTGNSVTATPTSTGTIRYSATSVTGLGCPTSTSVDITINPLPSAPAINITQPTCSTPSGIITITQVTGATYSIDGLNYQASNIFSGLTPGTYNVRIKNSGGCVSASTQATINAAPTGTPSYVFSIIDPTCTNATGGIVIQEPVGNNYEYNLNGGAYQSNPAFSNLPTGSYTTTVKDKTTGCVSPSSPFTIKPGPVLPAVPSISSTAATCLTAGTSTVSNYTNTITYTFSPSGPSLGAGGTISGMVTGTNYTVTASNGSCNSSPSNTFSNAAQLSAPATPTISSIAATCLTAGTSSISNYNSSLTYLFNPTGPNIGTGGVINGMVTGTNYTATAANGGCSSSASNSFSNAAQFTAPSAPVISTITQPTCTTPTGIITITQVAGVTYSINGNNYQTSNVFSGLTSGNYSLTAKNAAGCISTAIGAVIYNQPDCNTQDLFVPNAFTPNGDGKNDILFVKGTTIKSMQLLIFNQWGEKIFESVKQEQGWDGSVGGKAQPVGVYVYILKVGHNNGKTQQLKGSITLIR